jgi:hypothetical protein
MTTHVDPSIELREQLELCRQTIAEQADAIRAAGFVVGDLVREAEKLRQSIEKERAAFRIARFQLVAVNGELRIKISNLRIRLSEAKAVSHRRQLRLKWKEKAYEKARQSWQTEGKAGLRLDGPGPGSGNRSLGGPVYP